jgi:DNA-binding PadR family transcriptional regulator
MFTVDFDKASLKISEKIWNLTLNLVKKVLENAGLDEGDWFLKVPHRVRKKGHERFKALRLDNRVGANGIRVRCKPQGNETSFEYTLVPPEGTDLDDLFMLLQRVNPKTLEVHDTLALKAAIENTEYRNIEFPVTRAIINTLYKGIKSEPERPKQKIETISEPAGEDLGTATKPQNVDHEPVVKKDIAKELSPVQSDNIEKMSSLALRESVILSDQEALDRALIAMALVARDGYATRVETSNSIIENLEIVNFIKNVSNGSYVSIEGSMRSLMMALRKNNYIERVHYGQSRESVRGYKFTHKGEKRIVALKKFLDDKIIHRMGDSWGRFFRENQETDSVIELEREEIEKNTEAEAIVEEAVSASGDIFTSGDAVEDYARLESLTAALKDANSQIVEAKELISNISSEKEDLSFELFGLGKTIEEQIRQKEEIEKRITKFREKQEEIKKQIEKKEKEIVDWENFQVPYVVDMERIRKEIEELAGKVGIALK